MGMREGMRDFLVSARLSILVDLYKVNISWFLGLRLNSLLSKKLKVGFGPVDSDESTLCIRKYHIDPFVDEINRKSGKYCADIWFHPSEVSRFDIIVIVKTFDGFDIPYIKKLREMGKVFIYDVVDNPYGCRRAYDKEPEFIGFMDGIIAKSPLQKKDLDAINDNIIFIGSPLLNHMVKDYSRPEKGGIALFWEGYLCNMLDMPRLHPIILRVIRDTGKDVRMIYHTEKTDMERGKDEWFVEYRKWSLSNWERSMADADIAVFIKPPGDHYQQRKPSTKVQQCMAAGLPVVCTPTESDKMVVEHGRTGFFAYTDEEWYGCLKMLVEDRKLRERIGKAAQASVTKRFSVGNMARQYLDFFDKTAERAGKSQSLKTLPE